MALRNMTCLHQVNSAFTLDRASNSVSNPTMLHVQQINSQDQSQSMVQISRRTCHQSAPASLRAQRRAEALPA